MAKKRKNKRKNKEKIDPNDIKTRDHLMIALINGCTKAGIHDDKKKRASRDACRRFDDFEESE